MPIQKRENCIIKYTKPYGGPEEVLYAEACCSTFNARVNQTFLIKVGRRSPDLVEGINLVAREGEEVKVILCFTSGRGMVPAEDEIKFCPFCGATILFEEIPA